MDMKIAPKVITTAAKKAVKSPFVKGGLAGIAVATAADVFGKKGERTQPQKLRCAATAGVIAGGLALLFFTGKAAGASNTKALSEGWKTAKNGVKKVFDKTKETTLGKKVADATAGVLDKAKGLVDKAKATPVGEKAVAAGNKVKGAAAKVKEAAVKVKDSKVAKAAGEKAKVAGSKIKEAAAPKVEQLKTKGAELKDIAGEKAKAAAIKGKNITKAKLGQAKAFVQSKLSNLFKPKTTA